MNTRLSVVGQDWGGPFDPATTSEAVRGLETGQVIHLPELAFELTETERRFLTPTVLSRSKNVSRDPATGRLRGTACTGSDAVDLAGMIERYATVTTRLLGQLLPPLAPALRRGHTSYRPAEVEGRVSSWRKDDTRLHVDAFPSTPTGGERILRDFCNVNPHGRPRTWRLGEPFPALARRLWPRLRGRWVGSAAVLQVLRLTRGLRTDYDHMMLQLHDQMKADAVYQTEAPQTVESFAAGSTWICFTDQVSHAAVSGAFQFEQTFYLAVADMVDPDRSPFRVLERMAGRALVPVPRRRAA